MDLLDFDGEAMYFDEPPSPEVQRLLDEAAEHYGTDTAELALLRANFLAPDQLSVLVAMYRFFYYRHRYHEALLVADRAIRASAAQLGVDGDWRRLDDGDLGHAVQRSMAMTRFMLLALKGAGWLQMRLGDHKAALERFEKVAAFDSSDRLGMKELLTWARGAVAESEASRHGGNVQYIGR
jgi:tetratricopeptide (TPR) repeat protein